MTRDDLNASVSNSGLIATSERSKRLYYLDWLRVILLFGVFLYHVVKPFDPLIDWHITNTVRSDAIMSILLLINPWGIPLFFLVAGAGSLFSLRRRSNRQFISERVNRLLIPFIIGTIILMPFQKYLEALHKERYQGSFLGYFPELPASMAPDNWFSPATFGHLGLHLWFLAFLFAFSLLALPIFNWLKGNVGKSFISWLGRLVDRRGAILLLFIPLAIARFLVMPLSPFEEHGWLDFIYFFLFFILGFILYSDERFQSAVRRDRWLLFGSGIFGLAVFFGLYAVYGEQTIDWGMTFVFPGSIIPVLSFTLMSWGWALFALYLAMNYLNFSNKLLVYANDTILPFYLLHQPVIIVIAYFVVQWDAAVLVKLLVILFGSLFVTLGLVELLIRPFRPMRRLFGMKPRNGKVKAALT